VADGECRCPGKDASARVSAGADLLSTRRLHAVRVLATLIGPVLAGIVTWALRKSD
jgi:hypothetical protein